MTLRYLLADFAVVTPLFMGGADNKNSAELREASIKGGLRFWWRALAYGRLNGDLAAIRRQESALFGSTEGQSLVRLRLSCSQAPSVLSVGQVLLDERGKVVGPGARYLGYGVMEAFSGKNTEAGRLTRPCLKAPIEGTLRLSFLPKATEAQIREVADALIALGLLGGLGSKARKGYGSFNLLRLSGEVTWDAPQTIEAYTAQLQAWWGGHSPGEQLPAYTAFSRQSRVTLLMTGAAPMVLLDELGRKLQLYRSYGQNGLVNGLPSERNFQRDHDLMLRASQGATPSAPPQRVVFGLPHNYFFSSIKAKQEVSTGDRQRDRRGSPLFLHIHRIADTFVAVATILPAQFLPPRSTIKVGHSPVPADVDFNVLHSFIDGLAGPQGAKTGPRFSQKRDVITPLV